MNASTVMLEAKSNPASEPNGSLAIRNHTSTMTTIFHLSNEIRALIAAELPKEDLLRFRQSMQGNQCLDDRSLRPDFFQDPLCHG